jgi:hypothetical protein
MRLDDGDREPLQALVDGSEVAVIGRRGAVIRTETPRATAD